MSRRSSAALRQTWTATAHAVDRFRDRWAPWLDGDAARAELETLASGAVRVDPRKDLYSGGAGALLVMRDGVVVTVLDASGYRSHEGKR